MAAPTKTQDLRRYSINGRRPGEIYFTPHGEVVTDPVDGGARLKPAQKAYFEAEYGITEVGLVAPEPEKPALDVQAQARADARAAENKATAEARADEDQRLDKAKLAANAAKG